MHTLRSRPKLVSVRARLRVCCVCDLVAAYVLASPEGTVVIGAGASRRSCDLVITDRGLPLGLTPARPPTDATMGDVINAADFNTFSTVKSGTQGVLNLSLITANVGIIIQTAQRWHVEFVWLDRLIIFLAVVSFAMNVGQALLAVWLAQSNLVQTGISNDVTTGNNISLYASVAIVIVNGFLTIAASAP
jgi:hypothetical protein